MRERFGMPRLPPELGDHIISFLRSDPDALQVSSLVCKDWLSASRLYYPWTLSIDQGNVQALADLLYHPLSTFGKSSSMVEIWMDRWDAHEGNVEEVNVLDILAVHLGKINARSLVLSGSRWKPVREEHENALSNWLARITDLQLIGDLHHPDNFYTCCPLLERLTFVALRRVHLYAIERTPPTMYPPHLHTIRVSFEGTAIIPYWLGLSPGWRPIDRLELYGRHRCHIPVLAFVIDHPELPAYTLYIALRMDSSEIFSNSGWYWNVLNERLNRSQYTELRRVQIHLCIEPSDLCPDLVLDRIRESMPELESRRILELSLSFVALKPDSPQNRDVHLLDRIQRSLDF